MSPFLFHSFLALAHGLTFAVLSYHSPSLISLVMTHHGPTSKHFQDTIEAQDGWLAIAWPQEYERVF